VTAINGNTVTSNLPLFMALETARSPQATLVAADNAHPVA